MRFPNIYLPVTMPDLRPLLSKSKQSGLPQYLLMSDFVVYIDGIKIIIPVGFITDLASVPWGFRNTFYPGDPQTAAASLIHDFFYAAEILKRIESDRVFYAVLIYVGVDGPKEKPMFLAVYLFGWGTYRKHTADSVKKIRELIGLKETKRPLFKKIEDLQKLWEMSLYYKRKVELKTK